MSSLKSRGQLSNKAMQSKIRPSDLEKLDTAICLPIDRPTRDCQNTSSLTSPLGPEGTITNVASREYALSLYNSSVNASS